MTTQATHITFTVFGHPQSRGSKTPWLPRRKDGSLVMKNGRPVIATMDSNKKSKNYMAEVRQVAGEAFRGDLLRGPIRLSITFYFARPKAHFGSGKNAAVLKPSAPVFHTQTPDVGKLTRAVEDALTGVVWADDKQVCLHRSIGKVWTTKQERAEVEIEELKSPFTSNHSAKSRTNTLRLTDEPSTDSSGGT